jgi:hypothetical protein
MRSKLSDNRTSGKNRRCLRCNKARTITFYSLASLKTWCEEKCIATSLHWKKKLVSEGKVKLYWCSKKPYNIRLFALIDEPFILGCEERDLVQ